MDWNRPLEQPKLNENIRYEPDEPCPLSVSLGAALQIAVVALASVVVNTAVIVRAAGQSDSYLSWSIFGALAICGLTTVLQTVRIGPFGTGHILIMATSPVFAAVCITALVEGGPALLSSLIVAASLFQFVLAKRLSLARRIITPVTSGTVIMLIAATIMPIVLGLLEDVPSGTPPAAAPATAAVTLAVVVALALRGSPALQSWSPFIGILAGCAVAVFFGLYDFRRVGDASWIGIPELAWPGLDLMPGEQFWALLPAFILVTLISSIKTVAANVSVQQVSWRKPRATDFRIVQRSLNTEGVGRLLSGLAGTMPSTPDPSGASIITATGVASSSVGVFAGLSFVALAFSPKFVSAILSIPSPVIGAYMIFLLGLIFVGGIKTIAEEGVDKRVATIVGVSFWIGFGFQHESIFGDQLGGIWGTILGNGIIGGGLAAILMSEFIELTSRRRRRLDTRLHTSSLSELDDFLRRFASRSRLDNEATLRLRSAGEETLLSLVQEDENTTDGKARSLIVFARLEGRMVEMEFIASSHQENLEDRLAYLGQLGAPDEREISVRLLRHHASSVHHQKYHGVDVVRISVTT